MSKNDLAIGAGVNLYERLFLVYAIVINNSRNQLVSSKI